MTPSHVSRTLASVLEPVTGQVYFAPECHANYEALGFAASRGEFSGVMAPDGPAYFTSRGSVMGQVPGQVVAAAFGVFNPAIVVPAVDHGWSLTTAPVISAARDDGAMRQLRRLLGESPSGLDHAVALLRRATRVLRPEGRPLFSGLLSMDIPDSPIGEMWRLGDMLREFRGDSHTAAWISAGFTACEIGVLSELYWGLPIKSYSRTRGWTDSDYDEAIRRLVADSLVTERGDLTTLGRERREEIEAATDTQMQPVVEALGDEIHQLIDILRPWATTIKANKGYPAAGPHDLASAAAR